MEPEQQVTEQAVVFRPKKRDSAGRTQEVADSMDLPPREGARPKYPGLREYVALGGNAPQPPIISMVDQSYAEKVAKANAEYPRALYHKAFKRERDAAGKIVPNGEVNPLPTADAISPNYPTPLNMAERNGLRESFLLRKVRRQSSANTCTALALFLPAGRRATRST